MSTPEELPRWQFGSTYQTKDGSLKMKYRCPKCYRTEDRQTPFCPWCGKELYSYKEDGNADN